MAMHVHRLTRARIRRLFTTSPTPHARWKVFDAVRECPACARYYTQYQAAESALTGTDDPYTVFSIERTRAALFAHLDNSDIAPSSSKRPIRIVAPAAVAAAALAALFVLLPAGPTPDRAPVPSGAVMSPVTLTARGGYPPKDEADAGIRVFRVTEGGNAVDEGHALSIHDIITFTYTQVRRPGGSLALFGIQDTGDIRWYYPGYDGNKGIPIEGDKVDEPLKDGISLAVNHTPGALRITAVFSPTPLTKSDIEQAVSKLRAGPGKLEDLTPLAFTEFNAPTIQHSVIVDIGAGK